MEEAELRYKVTDSSVSTIVNKGNGEVLLTLKKGGECRVIAYVNDYRQAEEEVLVRSIDTIPEADSDPIMLLLKKASLQGVKYTEKFTLSHVFDCIS